jgi:hypothetical protein
MKKLVLAVTLLVAGVTNAQDIKFGVKGGLNISSLNGGDAYYGSYGSKIGFHVGGLAEVKINDKFSVQPEVLLSSKGTDYNYGLGFYGLGTTSKVNLLYVDLPVMVKFYPIPHLSAELGPNVGVLVSAKNVGNTTVDVKNDYNSVDFGMNIGAGYELKQGIMFQLRYNIGLADVSKDFTSGYNYTDKNSVLSLSVGYKF